jgi:hypothetical protein
MSQYSGHMTQSIMASSVVPGVQLNFCSERPKLHVHLISTKICNEV